MIALVAAAIALSPVLQQDVRVSFTHPAAPAPRVIAMLAQQSGQKLRASQDLSGESLLIHVQDTPLSELQQRIATVTSGQWVTQGDEQVLMPNQALRRRQETEAHQQRVEQLRKAVKSKIDWLNKPVKEGQEQREMSFFGGGGDPRKGADKAIIRLLPSLDLNVLAGLGRTGRVVFSTAPTRMQRPLPGFRPEIITDLVNEHNAGLRLQTEPQFDSDEERAMYEMFRHVMPRDKRIETTPTKLLIIAQPAQWDDEGVQLELRLFDGKGDVLVTGMQSLSEMYDFDHEPEVDDDMDQEEEEQEEEPPTTGTRIEFSPLTREMLRMSSMDMFMSGVQMPQMSNELQTALRRPDLHDPLSFYHSEAAIAVAKHKKLNLVANLPDDFLSFGFGMSENATIEQFYDVLDGMDEVVLTEDGGWLVVVPGSPIKSRQNRFDRVALARLLQSTEGLDYVPLDAMAEYALAAEPPSLGSSAAILYFAMFAPSILMHSMAPAHWNILRLWGSLQPPQRQALKQGASIPISQLSAQQRAIVDKAVYGANPQLQVDGDTAPESLFGIPMMDMMMGGMLPQAPATFKQEPTEVAPNGVPPQGAITMKTEAGFLAKPELDRQMPFNMMATAGIDELAMYVAFSNMPGMEEMTAFMPRVDKLRVGERTTMHLALYVAPDVALRGTLHDDRIPKDAPTYSLNNLPESVKKDLDARVEALKQSPFFKMMPMIGGQGRRTPPPSP